MNDEHDFVADSEEEEDSMETGMGKRAMDWQEGISTFGPTNVEEEQRRIQQMSSISDFTVRLDGGETSTTISAFTTPSVKPPRPRPRPIKKRTTEGVDGNSSHISMFSRPEEPEQSTSRQATNGTIELGGEFLDFTATSSIADRAKTRQRKQSGPSAAQQWDDDDDFISPKPKQKAKAVAEPDYMQDEQPGKSKTAKDKDKAGKTNDILDISSDEDDELFLKRNTTKPKPVSSPRTSSLQPTELVTKPPRPRPRPVTKKSKGAGEGLTSNPASDHRISTPANPPPDTDLVSSHPKGHQNLISSLPPSDPPVPSTQTNAYSVGLPAIETLPQPPSSNGRKTPLEFDELFSGDDDLFGPEPVAQAHAPTKLPPPPTFFAGSSSQVNPSGGQTPTVQEGGVLDLTTLSTQSPEKDPKPKAKRKKKVSGEDDDDGDWGAVSSKPKEKKAPKKKKAQVEVVITTKPPGKEKGDKGKKQRKKDDDMGGSSRKAEKTKEVFKSRETIEDSDEDPLLESYRPEETAAALLSRPGGASSKDKPFDDNLAPKGRSEEPIAPLEDDMDLAEDDVAPVARKDSRRKRKSMVVDDEEDFHEGSSRKEQSANKRQKKEKQVRQQDPSEGQAATPAMTSSRKQKGKAKAAVIISEDEEEPPAPDTASLTRNEEVDEPDLPKENIEPSPSDRPGSSKPKPAEQNLPKPPPVDKPRQPRHSIGSRVKGTPMSELIKRVNSLPSSPFPVATSSRVPTMSRIATSYSPYLKSSRSMLSRIAPLHPNRRTPPPALPPPPPRKKTKKELEREEKWEEELIESLGGLEAWIALSNGERRDMRKAKFDMEMGGWDE